MQLSILGFRIQLEVLILIGIIYLIFLYHTVCPCVNMPMLYESLTNMASTTGSKAGSSSTAAAQDKNKVPASTTGKKEGFSSGYGAYDLGQSAPYTLGDYSMPNVSNWFQSDLNVQPGKQLSPGVQEILNRPAQPVPLPEGEMLLFANTKFSAEACPTSYSNGSGCAEMTVKQFNYLQTRGGNNQPYSEY